MSWRHDPKYNRKSRGDWGTPEEQRKAREQRMIRDLAPYAAFKAFRIMLVSPR